MKAFDMLQPSLSRFPRNIGLLALECLPLLLLGLPTPPAIAQGPIPEPNSTPNPLQDLSTQDDRDPFSGSNGQFSVFDLIHRSRLGSSQTLQDFTEGQNTSLDQEAEAFRARQRQLLQQQPSPGVPSPAVNP